MDQTLTTFCELIRVRPGEWPGDSTRRASHELPARVRASHLRWWTPSDPIAAVGKRLLVGVAVWSGYDMRNLDLLDAHVATAGTTDLTVDVFDCDRTPSTGGFDAYIPGIGSVHHSPAVGLWIDGRLVDKECGYAGRQIISRVVGIDIELLCDPGYTLPQQSTHAS